MKTPLWAIFALCLWSSEVLAQEQRPLLITDIIPSKTSVIAREPFRVTYVIQFKDGTDIGKRVEVLTDQLASMSFGLFQVVPGTDYDIEKSKSEDVYIWKITWTLFIISPDTGNVWIPPISISYFVREMGKSRPDTVSIALSDSLAIRYVSPITAQDRISIRDYPDFDGSGRAKLIFWFALLVVVGIVVLLGKELMFGSSAVAEVPDQEEDKGQEILEKSRIAPWLARWRLDAKIAHITNVLAENKMPLMDIERELYGSVYELLRAELQKAPWGATPNDLKSLVMNLPSGRRREILAGFAWWLCAYEKDLESGKSELLTSIDNIRSHLRDLRMMVNRLDKVRFEFEDIKRKLRLWIERLRQR